MEHVDGTALDPYDTQAFNRLGPAWRSNHMSTKIDAFAQDVAEEIQRKWVKFSQDASLPEDGRRSLADAMARPG